MDALDIWRFTNAILSLAALVALMLDFRVVRQDLGSRRIYLTFSLAGLLSAAVLGSIYNIILENAVSPATPIISASVVWCLIGLWVSRHDRPSLWKDFPK